MSLVGKLLCLTFLFNWSEKFNFRGRDRCQTWKTSFPLWQLWKKIELKSSKKLLGHGTEGYFIHTVRLVYPIDFYLIKKGSTKKATLSQKLVYVMATLCDILLYSLLSIDMKTKVVQHVPRINIIIWHNTFDMWQATCDMRHVT